MRCVALPRCVAVALRCALPFAALPFTLISYALRRLRLPLRARRAALRCRICRAARVCVALRSLVYIAPLLMFRFFL